MVLVWVPLRTCVLSLSVPLYTHIPDSRIEFINKLDHILMLPQEIR